MSNLEYYNKLRTVPAEAIKSIQAGRLRGMSDINPMWRIKVMTETFGMCGIGWKYVITKQWTEQYGDEVKAYCNVDLFVKVDGEWSCAIQGTGGSSEVAKEKNGLYVSDECYKMALTDALSVAMKSLGVAADVYFERDKTKYTVASDTANAATTPQYNASNLSEALSMLQRCSNKEQLIWVGNTYKPLLSNSQFMQAYSAKRKEIGL